MLIAERMPTLSECLVLYLIYILKVFAVISDKCSGVYFQ